jgi:hypothetical protein
MEIPRLKPIASGLSLTFIRNPAPFKKVKGAPKKGKVRTDPPFRPSS